MGASFLRRKFEHDRKIDGQIRRAVGERHAFHQRRVGIDHRGRDHFVVLSQRLLERLHRLVRFGGLDVGLGRSAPHGDEATGAAGLSEIADVVAQLLGEIHLGLALLHVGPVDLLHVVVIEHGSARLNRREKRLQLLEQAVVEHARIGRGFVHVVFEDVPAGEDQIVESGERDKFLHLGRAPVGALAQAHGAHLRERSDGLRQAFADGLDAGDEGGGHRAHARNHHAELALGGLDGAVSVFDGIFGATGTGRQFHLPAGALGVSEGGFAVLMLRAVRFAIACDGGGRRHPTNRP